MNDFVARFQRAAVAAACVTASAMPCAWAQGQPTATDRAATRAADRAAVRSGDYIVAIVNQELVTAVEVSRRLARAQEDAQRTDDERDLPVAVLPLDPFDVFFRALCES